MSAPNAKALFDCLAIGSRLCEYGQTTTERELHLFAYLSRLLSVYEGIPASEWGYTFLGTESGAPFSLEVRDALDHLLYSRLVFADGATLRFSEDVKIRVDAISAHRMHQLRTRLIDAACSALTVLPRGALAAALSADPQLTVAAMAPANRELFTEHYLELIYRQVDILKAAMPAGTHDMRVPASVWMSALHEASLQ